MSLFSPSENERDLANVVNRIHRHCRIGRVTKKVQILGGKWVIPPYSKASIESPEWWMRGCRPLERIVGVFQ